MYIRAYTCIYIHLRAYAYIYMHIRTYTYIRCPQLGVSICTYSLEIHSLWFTYGSSQPNIRLPWSHIRAHMFNIRAYTYVYVCHTSCTYTIRSVPYVVRILHVFASIIENIRSHTADRMLIYTYAHTCILSGSLMGFAPFLCHFTNRHWVQIVWLCTSVDAGNIWWSWKW